VSDTPTLPPRSRFRGAVVVSIVVLVTFAVVLALVLTRALPETSHDLAMLTVGSLTTMAGAVVQYWVGSSDGSSEKNAIMARRPE
jgi:hypothetical protein